MKAIIVMRLKDMKCTHPNQNNSHVCSECGEQVGIYPSGQAVLKKDPKTEIICNACIEGLCWIGTPAPGAIDEFIESVRKRNEN